MNAKRIKALKQSFVHVMMENQIPRSKNAWRRFKRGFYAKRIDSQGRLAQPRKQHQANVLKALGYSGHGLRGLVLGNSLTRLRKFITKKMIRVTSLTEVTTD